MTKAEKKEVLVFLKKQGVLPEYLKNLKKSVKHFETTMKRYWKETPFHFAIYDAFNWKDSESGDLLWVRIAVDWLDYLESKK